MAATGDGRIETVAAALVAEHVAIHDLPSVAWGVVRDGGLVAGADTESVYRIASMTKSFTCAAVLILRDAGVLALDDPIARYAPEYAHLVGPTADSPAITIRHLMTMGAGFATDDPWADRHLDVADAELDAWLAPGVTFAVPTDTAWEYSNLGFGVLGRVVERASGTRLQDLVRTRLLEPLDLTRTTWTAPSDARPGHRRRRDEGDEPLLGDGAIAPMGGLFTTIADLARWVGFLQDAWPARDDPDAAPLSRASRREMQRVHRAFPPRVVTTRDGRHRTIVGGYGFGLNVMHHETLGWVVSHSGGLPGFGSNMRWVPSAGIGLVACSNATYAPMAELTAAVLDAFVADDLVAARPTTPGDALRGAAAALVALHNEWDDVRARELFADNVEPDDALDRRAARAAALSVRGPFRLARVEADTAASGTAIAHGPDAELHLELQLAPLAAARVQWYEARLEG